MDGVHGGIHCHRAEEAGRKVDREDRKPRENA